MADIVRPERFARRTEAQDAHRFLSVCLAILEKHLGRARADKNQKAIEAVLPLLATVRRQLRELPVEPQQP